MSRQPGWYWVKCDGEWMVAYYGVLTWTWLYMDMDGFDEMKLHEDKDVPFAEIGPRIPTPDETEGYQCVPKELTSEGGYKAALIGEFSEGYVERCPECEEAGDEEDCIICLGAGEVHVQLKDPVSWTNIKAIHRRIVELAAAPKPETQP